MKPIALGILSTIVLCGCAGRAPQLVQSVKATDQNLTCDALRTEIKFNNDRIVSLAQEEGLKVTQNVVAGIAGLVVWPLWFAMDFQDAAGKEGQALSQRNQYLASIAADKCGAPETTASTSW